jgi:hypothetical protein
MEANWVAECRLCEWRERHVVQDDALKAATSHSIKSHTDEHAALKTGEWITHVQNRADDAIGVPQFKPGPSPEILPPLTLHDPVEEASAAKTSEPEGE